MGEEIIDAAKFLELYGKEIKEKRALSRGALKQAVAIFEDNRDDDEGTVKWYIDDLCDRMVEYKYLTKSQGKFEIMSIRDSCTKLNLALFKVSDILKRKIDVKLYISEYITFCKIDLSDDEEIQSLTLEKLTDFNFIQSFLEKYAANNMSRRYLRLE